MTKVVIETPATFSSGRLGNVRVVDLSRLIQPDRALICPRCGCSQFTAAASENGDLVLSCWREPTHLRVRMPE